MKEQILLLDGGMGTLLQAAGLRPGEMPERWCLTHPEEIKQIHRAYYNSGSHVVNTNTFGANALKLSHSELEEIVAAAVSLARAAAAESERVGEKWVALDIGPTGRLLRPYGDLDFEDAVEVFAETVRLGVKYGVDLIFIETMNDSLETKAALLAAKENSKLPVFVSNAYGGDGKLMTGASPEAMVAMLEGMGADAIGANCSLGPNQLLPVAEKLLACASVPVFLKPNAGLPTERDGETVFDVTPEEFAETLAGAASLGLSAMGGCCGTTPEYIRLLSAGVEGKKPLKLTPKRRTVVSSYTHAVTFGECPILIGERINPTGKKRFKQALTENDLDYILQEGIRQQEHGAQILDVNVGLPQIDEREMLTRVTAELQAVLDLPLQIDTADPIAMESALRRYNGKAMINSVNGKRESMESVFPLARKYGGVVVALTLDENGIPATAEERLAIAKRILKVARSYGIKKEDLVFDPLAMTVSADPRAAVETLKAVRLIRQRLGCHTSLGVSNVSFGLPVRDAVNATFFAQAMENGLSAAIMNPYADSMLRAWYTHRVLHGLDENCADYMAYAASCEETSANAAPMAKNSSAPAVSDLKTAVIKGLSEQAARLTDQLLEKIAPMAIVQAEIIPALNEVGQGFEAKRLYLPQLLMSAEAAKSAFERIKAQVKAGGVDGMTVVLATVEGDVHDIGKNIVRLLLENYGFCVVDLGKDVPAARVLEAVLETRAPMVGLSALMTTTVPAMEETVALLHSKAPFCRVAVGGAVLTEEYAARIGADRYCADAMETVRYAQAISGATLESK
ncbi:MAG: homocysteine methyltransferase [Ruminococcaceae bacterium]|nr:homocysteine methyltransferase [Oscillospiraceae bacterium]